MVDIELIEPIKVIIAPIDKDETLYDDGLEGMMENSGHIERLPAVEITAQVAYGNTDQVTAYQNLAPDERVSGYLLVMIRELNEKGISLKRGDLITKIGNDDVDYVLLHSKGDPTAQISSLGGFTLVRMFFSDKTPLS